jgi:hypothetical protein
MRDVIAGHYSRAGMLLVGVISKIKQNSSDMNEILLAPCDAGYVQNCTGLILSPYGKSHGNSTIALTSIQAMFFAPPDSITSFGPTVAIIHA